jgi:nucleoporin GLE1
MFEELNGFTDRESFNVYISLQQYLQTFEDSYRNLLKDDRLKKFRFDCQKAVNIPVNAISPISADHLQDKLFKLSSVISGQPVKVGNDQVIAASHPEGIAFCKNLLAKKFVCQGELTVSSRPEAAFAIAAVIEALWADFPDFGQQDEDRR